MFDHVGITVRDLAKSKAFYAAALKPLGLVQGVEFPGWTSFGPPGHSRFWIAQGSSSAAAPRVHLAFKADRAGVDAFYAAALAAGGADNGAPGPRPHYHEHYYGAFVIDPDGYNVEAVCHDAPHHAGRPPRASASRKPATSPGASKKAGAKKPAQKRAARKSAARKSAAPKSTAQKKASPKAGAARGSRATKNAKPAAAKPRVRAGGR